MLQERVHKAEHAVFNSTVRGFASNIPAAGHLATRVGTAGQPWGRGETRAVAQNAFPGLR